MATIKQAEEYLADGNSQKLIKALKDRDLLVRRFAAKALGMLEDPDAVPYLLGTVKENTDQYVIRNALESLRFIKNSEAIDALIQTLFDRDNYRSRLAEKQLREIQDQRSQDAMLVKTLILENDFQKLREEPRFRRILQIIMHSQQYQQWPSGKRKQIGEIAITSLEEGVIERTETIRDLAEMGLFVGGIHDLGDLLKALDNPNASVRIRAAEKIGENSSWLGRLTLRKRFSQELAKLDSHEVSAAYAQALLKMNDVSGFEILEKSLYQSEGEKSFFAARALAALRTDKSLLTLFRYCENPPTSFVYKNNNIILGALESAGARAVDVIFAQPGAISENGLLLAIDLIVKVRYPEATVLLSDFVLNDNVKIRDAAISALVRLNTNAAAMSLRDLASFVPKEMIIEALSMMSAPQSSRFLSAILPENTSIEGRLKDQAETSIENARIRILREHFFGEKEGWGVMPSSHETVTRDDGSFLISIPSYDEEWHCSIKVITPAGTHESQTFTAAVSLKKGEINAINLKIDRKYSHLIIQSIEKS